MPIPALAAVLLKVGAPLLANAVLAKGKAWVEEKTGVKLDAATMGAGLSPEDAAKVRQWELENEVELAELKVEDNRIEAELEKARLADIANARNRDLEFVKQGRKNERGDNLAYLAVVGLLATIATLFFVEVTPVQERILLVALGALIKIVGDVYAFEFGSSKDAAKMANSMTKWLDEEGGSK